VFGILLRRCLPATLLCIAAVMALVPQPALGQCLIVHTGRILYEDGSPAAGMTVVGLTAFGPFYGVTSSSGNYGICIPQYGTSTTIYPMTPAGTRSAPASRTCGYNGSCDDQNFTITRAKVEGNIGFGGNFDPSGVEIVVDGQVATVTDVTGSFSFRPVKLGLPAAGQITPRMSFRFFVPGTISYAVGPDDQILNPIAGSVDVDAEKSTASWEAYSGAGWDYFPLSPVPCFLNYPNVFATVDLDDAYFSTPVSANSLRLVSDSPEVLPAPVYASAEVNASNGFVATFSHPIVGCGRGYLKVEVGLPLTTGETYWAPLEILYDTGTSSIDLTGDGLVNLSDVSVFALAIGTSEGESGFDPCADYVPNGVIDLSDVGVFSAAYSCASSGAPPAISLADAPAEDRPRALRLEPISPNPSRASLDLVVRLGSPTGVDVDVLDVAGRVVRRVPVGRLGEGRHTVTWDGRDATGSRVAAGVYFVRVRAGSESAVHKIVRLD
jgi:hypothetical protein